MEKIGKKLKIVYIDEISINQQVIREYGYVKRGQKIQGKISGKKLNR